MQWLCVLDTLCTYSARLAETLAALAASPRLALKYVITVSGSCTKFPQVSDKTFDDSAYGGPKQVSAEVCVARG